MMLAVAVDMRKLRWRHMHKIVIFHGIAFLS